MKVIVLAAGLGSRLGPLTRETPKASVPVAGRPLIRRAIRFARYLQASDVVVVGGYNSERLWEVLGDEPLTRIENPGYRKGNLYTLAAAREHLADDFVLMNVDHLYPSHLARMIRETGDGVWGIVDFDRPLYHDDMKVQIAGSLDSGATVAAISKGLADYDGGYCGMTTVRGAARERYLEAFENVLGHGRDQAVVEDVLAELVRLGHPPRILDISGVRWLEVDTQEDLGNAERILRMKPHFLD